jgi:hypothetical protein
MLLSANNPLQYDIAANPTLTNGNFSSTVTGCATTGQVAHPERLHADGEKLLRALRMTAAENDDLLAFLHTLTDSHGADRPRPMAPGVTCGD